jgi:hypothetical protein
MNCIGGKDWCCYMMSVIKRVVGWVVYAEQKVKTTADPCHELVQNIIVLMCYIFFGSFYTS